MNSPPSNSEDPPRATDKETRAFQLLHDDVKRWIWKQGWQVLRPLQEEAIPPILAGERDVILSSPTASGKTEAAFLPIFSRIAAQRDGEDAPQGGFNVLYISPLKALINDQFERLDTFSKVCDIPVHRRHGDVSSSRKRRALDQPDGVLLITPESLEALFIHHGPRLHRALHNLSYVVIDELHSFIGTPRGRQLQSLLARVEHAMGRRIPRIALSATIGDTGLAAEFLRPDDGGRARVIASDHDRQAIKLLVKGYEIQAESPDGGEEPGEPTGTHVDIAEHIFEHLRGKNNLVFANRRAEVELYADVLKRLSERARVPIEFHPHHGSLSKEIREGAERALKAPSPASVVCTTTLELGIDIGQMHSIAQLGAPPSVASMRQRLGRSGRGDDPAILRAYVQEPEIGEGTPVQDMLRPELVQTIAMVNLLLDSWYEPPPTGALELSTLVQQVLSVIAEHGGIRAKNAYKILCRDGPFRQVSSDRFARLLRRLGEADLISQAGDGELIMGLTGERLISHYDFYAAFWTPDEYRLVTEEKTLGTLPLTYPLVAGQLLIFGGRRWEIQEIQESNRVVFLRPARGGRVPLFGGAGAQVHRRVREEMYRVYTSSEVPPYLDPKARDLLSEGRMHFKRFRLAERSVISQGSHSVLFLWAGDREIDTVWLQLSQRGLSVSKAGASLSARECTVEDLTGHLRALREAGAADPVELAQTVKNMVIDKHDRYLDEVLLTENYASKSLDARGAFQALDGVLNPSRLLERNDRMSGEQQTSRTVGGRE